MAVLLLILSYAGIDNEAFAQETGVHELRIATFNIQNFGKKKLRDDRIRRYLAGIVRKFDIVAVQEVSDASEETPLKFLDEVNSQGARYQVLLSERSGRERSWFAGAVCVLF